MGKISAAKKKERRKDFQKVKFKVGKKLPKNLNETRATFKAKSLILKTQFQLEKEGPVSHRNLSWNELLAHLSHHNQSIKLDAIHSLKEMITNNQEIIRLDMNNFLENICPLFADRDYKVREACMQLFKTFILLPEMAKKSNSLEPFYSLLNVHLSCAMTHISENVQYDSLKLLDILIEHLPDLVRVNAYTIFENFVDQISKATLKSEKRVLKNDPYKMTSTQTWRSKVLSRLFKMLQIVSAVSEMKLNKASQMLVAEANAFNFESTEWKMLPSNRSQSLMVNIDEARQFSIITSDCNGTKRSSLKTCQRLNAKKNLNDIREFFEYYFKVITPLLSDCWIEAKPENKNIIDTYESLSIMNSVLSILNLLLENLHFDFSHFGKLLRSSTSINQIKYIEHLFLGHFPYSLAESFEYGSDSKKSNQQISANTINLLLCKLCSSSLLQLTEERLLEIFQYSLNSLVVANDHERLELNELITVLNLSKTIFDNFTNTDITKPFLIALTKYFDATGKFSNNKWLVFEFLCREFYENNNLKDCDVIFLNFFKKLFAFCILYAKNKRDKLETMIDWIRKLIVKKENRQKSILTLLENEYINMLNALDFESKEVTESCKKKLLELIYWLPSINRFLFTKLSILILKKNLSVINTNQILGILKTRLDRNDSSFVQSDYLMFLASLTNGSSGFDLMNNPPASEFYTLDYAKFKHHEKLCQHLEEFIKSNKNSDTLIDILISSSVPMFTQLPSVMCRTLYGSLCLVHSLSSVKSTPDNYNHLINWFSQALFWLLNRIQSVQVNQLGTREQVEQELECLNAILNKISNVYNKNGQFLNDTMPHMLRMLQVSNNLEHIRKMFVVINFLLVKFGASLRPSSEALYNIFQNYQSFNESNNLWWHEYCNLIKSL